MQEKKQDSIVKLIELWITCGRKYNKDFLLSAQQKVFCERHFKELLTLTTWNRIAATIHYCMGSKKWAHRMESTRDLMDLWNAITYEMNNGTYDPKSYAQEQEKTEGDKRAKQLLAQTKNYLKNLDPPQKPQISQ